jgi:hypothetical protein
LLNSGAKKYHPFYEGPLLRVRNPKLNTDRKPGVEAAGKDDDDLIIFLRLVKEGYAGSLKEAMELDARTVVQALYYEAFLGMYQDTYVWLNKG